MGFQQELRALRRARGLTQEQLAEAMCVSPAAVSKWETGQSIPDLSLVTALADYFEVSLDVLTGYAPQSRRRTELLAEVERLTMARELERAAEMAEDALRRYPNDFPTVLAAAKAYCARRDEASRRRALALVTRALALYDGQERPEISRERLLYAQGVCHACLGEYELAEARFEAGNVRGVNDMEIAACRQARGRYDEARPLLSDGLITGVLRAVSSALGLAACAGGERPEEAVRLLTYVRRLLDGLEKGAGSYINKIRAVVLTTLADAQLSVGRAEEARSALREAVLSARLFDESPNYGADSVGLCCEPRGFFHDAWEETAMATVRGVIDRETAAAHRAVLRAMLEEEAAWKR